MLLERDISLIITPEVIFSYYLNIEVKLGKLYKNPLRDDNKAGCSFFITHSGELRFTDFAEGKSYTWLEIVKAKYRLDDVAALRKVIDELHLMSNNVSKCESKLTELDIITKYFSVKELSYWKQFGITLDILKMYDVHSVKFMIVNGNVVKDNKFTFAYRFGNKYKIYRPHDKERKWTSNVNELTIEGLDQLRSSNVLIITKSLKDVMTFRVLGFNAIASISESVVLNEERLEDLRRRYRFIFTYLDNDATGIKLTERYANLGIPSIRIYTKVKDISDLYKIIKLRCIKLLRKAIRKTCK